MRRALPRTLSSTRWLLWLTLLFTVPVPYFMIEAGRVPAAELIVFAALTSAVALTDPDFASRLIAVVFVVQAGFYAALLYAAARLAARRLGRLAPGTRRLAVGLAAAACLAASLFPIYRTPLARSGLKANLLAVYH